MLRQLENYDRQRKRLGRNDIIEYHRDHLDTAVSELRLMIEPLEYELEMVDKAISAAQLQIGKKREEQQRDNEVSQQRRHREAMKHLTGVEINLARATVGLAIVTFVLVAIEFVHVVHLIYEDRWTEALILSLFLIAFAMALTILSIRAFREWRGG